MQKLELRNNLKEIIDRIKSKTIIEFFKNQPAHPGGHSDTLLSLIIESKSGFDQSILSEKQKKILEQFDANKYYEVKFFAIMLKFVSTNNYDRSHVFLQNCKEITEFYTFHNTLLTSFNLVNNLLFQDTTLRELLKTESYSEAEKEGLITFEILSDINVDFQIFSTVIVNLNDLIQVVIEVSEVLQNKKYDEKPVLFLADSGSNTAISIKLPKEISQSLAKIINEVWQLISNRTGFRINKLSENIEQALDILKKIDKARTEKTIEDEQAELWKRRIVKATTEVVMNNAITKSKAEEIFLVSNQKMLTEATKKYLTEGKK